MLIGEKGCDANSPGIGDIAHVKDLITEKIVTTNFRCAKFGVPYYAGTKFGWVCIELARDVRVFLIIQLVRIGANQI